MFDWLKQPSKDDSEWDWRKVDDLNYMVKLPASLMGEIMEIANRYKKTAIDVIKAGIKLAMLISSIEDDPNVRILLEDDNEGTRKELKLF